MKEAEKEEKYKKARREVIKEIIKDILIVLAIWFVWGFIAVKFFY